MKKCAIVTGGSRGIGRAICQKLASETDYHILINYQSNEKSALETLQQTYKGKPITFVTRRSKKCSFFMARK